MHALIRSTSAAAVICFTLACSKVESSKDDIATETFDGKEILTISDQGLSKSGEALTGNGSVVFRSPLGETGSDKNFRLTFSLADSGSLDLVTHADESLSGGNTVRLFRSGDVLQASLIGSGTAGAARNLTGIAAATEITLLIDVHNGEDPAHILIWSTEQSHYDDDQALFNSDADTAASGRGFGNFWGLSLKQATVRSAAVGEAVFGH